MNDARKAATDRLTLIHIRGALIEIIDGVNIHQQALTSLVNGDRDAALKEIDRGSKAVAAALNQLDQLFDKGSEG